MAINKEFFVFFADSFVIQRIPGIWVWNSLAHCFTISGLFKVGYFRLPIVFSSCLISPLVPRFGSFSLCPPLNSAYFTVFRLNLPLPVFSFIFCSPWSSLGIFIPVNLWGGTGLSMWETSMAPMLRMKGGEKSNLLSCQPVIRTKGMLEISIKSLSL